MKDEKHTINNNSLNKDDEENSIDFYYINYSL